jgi:nucleoside-diphosphate-sugar epimerase
MGDYPNTYTYTKALAERSIQKNRGNLPVTILRPSIIIANFDDPIKGWIDTLAASGGIILGISLGVMHFVRSSPKAIIDFIPCDFVSNQILV